MRVRSQRCFPLLHLRKIRWIIIIFTIYIHRPPTVTGITFCSAWHQICVQFITARARTFYGLHIFTYATTANFIRLCWSLLNLRWNEYHHYNLKIYVYRDYAARKATQTWHFWDFFLLTDEASFFIHFVQIHCDYRDYPMKKKNRKIDEMPAHRCSFLFIDSDMLIMLIMANALWSRLLSTSVECAKNEIWKISIYVFLYFVHKTSSSKMLVLGSDGRFDG